MYVGQNVLIPYRWVKEGCVHSTIYTHRALFTCIYLACKGGHNMENDVMSNESRAHVI